VVEVEENKGEGGGRLSVSFDELLTALKSPIVFVRPSDSRWLGNSKRSALAAQFKRFVSYLPVLVLAMAVSEIPAYTRALREPLY